MLITLAPGPNNWQFFYFAEFESSSPYFPSEPFGDKFGSFRDKFGSFPRKFGGKIGDFSDKAIPLIYCARKLTALFLLPDEKGDLVSDSMKRY